MSDIVNRGSQPYDENADTAYDAMGKINQKFDNVDQSLGNKVENDDARLSDSREWSASTVTQTAAEAGTATTRRAWTAQRVRQAIVAWWSGVSIAISKVTGLQSELDGKEPTFTKNTGFNKDFGASAGTVTQGNDSRLSDARQPTVHDNTKHSTNYETEGTASSVMSSHESNHPVPTNRDTRNAASSHSHVIGDLPVATSGTSNTTEVVRADDLRLSNARTPVSHNNDQHSTNYEPAFSKNTGFNRNKTSSRTSTSSTLLLEAKAMNSHRTSGDHDGRYLQSLPSHNNTHHSTNYEEEGTASSLMSSHESSHPVPTNRDARNAAASHDHTIGDLPVTTSGVSSTTKVVRADDLRLSNSRTPTSHGDSAHSETYIKEGDARLTDSRTPEQHDNSKHSTNYETAFSKNTAFNKNFGNSSGTVTEGNDNRLSDAREPTSHGNEKHSTNYEPELNTDQKRKITYGTADPSGGSDGDIYLQYE